MEKCRLQQDRKRTQDADSQLLAGHCGVCQSGLQRGNQLLAQHKVGVPGTESEMLPSTEKHFNKIGQVKSVPKINSISSSTNK